MNKGTQKRRKVLSKLKNSEGAKVKLICDNFSRKCKDNFQRTWQKTADCSFEAS